MLIKNFIKINNIALSIMSAALLSACGGGSCSNCAVPVVPPSETAVQSATPDVDSDVGDIKVYKPFYINFTLSGSYSQSVTNTVMINGVSYGSCNIPAGSTKCSVKVILTSTTASNLTLSVSPSNVSVSPSSFTSIVPLGRYAYVMGTQTTGTAADNKIYILSYDPATGGVNPSTSFVTVPGIAQSIVGSKDGNYIYVNANDGGAVKVITYQVNSSTGALTQSSILTVNSSATSNYNTLAFDSTGKHLYVAYNNGITVYDYSPINGALTSPSTVVSGDAAQSMAFTPNGKFMYVPNKGGGSNSPTPVGVNALIYMYSVDSSTGALTPLSPATIQSPANWPASSLVDPTGKYLYVPNVGSTSTPFSLLSVFDINTETGLLSLHSPSTIATGPGPAAIIMDPTSQYLYTANYTNYTSNGSVSMFSIPANGTLNPLSPATVSSNGVTPATMAIDPSNTYLYVINAISYSIQKYTFGANGSLTASGSTLNIINSQPSPGSVGFTGFLMFGN